MAEQGRTLYYVVGVIGGKYLGAASYTDRLRRALRWPDQESAQIAAWMTPNGRVIRVRARCGDG